ncbi:uncharacterized protein N7473_004313 [Penicillium subrubescens]|uniref:Uncharacterized protein n=1 Tax=Penicillium subrubescens TaxID=1316194 RepID=A0A1Q5UDD9_9EURO|nr:uncharacterized protein N7473_004313 [Penicillium subrubescens]KAJ5900243.1 hypothetical protein N7473_004313 [Penicillium subrubescens]OKP10483.1 hypothetical protein PENSUB_4088 [Penicillium subrubescens]
MSGHDESSEMSLRCPSLFENVEEVPLNLMESAIKSDLLSKPLGSHEALHFFLEELNKDNTHPLIKKAIEAVLRSPSLRQDIEIKWNLSRNYGCAKRRQHMMDKRAPYDLASWCIEKCPRCFNLLLDHQTVQPSAFCENGYNFFWLAVRSGKNDLMQRIVSLMDLEDLLHPFSMREPEADRYTIFQASTWNRKWFQVCWERLKSCQDNGLTSLGPDEIGHICRFADVDLAKELLESGLDLGKSRPENASPGWLEIVGRKDPEPMLNWFLSRGHQPPEKLLTYAATCNCTQAASWIMRHTESHLDWREAALVAAENPDDGSAEILEIILQDPVAKWKADQTLSQNIVIKTINGVCQERKKYEAFLSDKFFQKKFAEMEDVAVRKIQALGEVVRNVEVLGVKITANDTGLCRLAMALENMNQHC